jgi:hypothetical protein
MFVVEVYAAIRHFVFVEGNSRREAARVFGLSRETVFKMCRFPAAAVYTHEAGGEAEAWPLAPGDGRDPRGGPHGPLKQRHPAKRIFERLRDEHNFGRRLHGVVSTEVP